MLPSMRKKSHTEFKTMFLKIASFLYMSPLHFLLCLLSVLGEGCCALLTWVQWSIAYFISPNKTNFSTFCPVSYHWESFVFTCCLVSFQEFFSSWGLLRYPGFSGLQPCSGPRSRIPSFSFPVLSGIPLVTLAGQYRPGVGILLQSLGTAESLSRLPMVACFPTLYWGGNKKALKEWVPFDPWFSVLLSKNRKSLRGDSSLKHSQLQSAVILPKLHVSPARWQTLPVF